MARSLQLYDKLLQFTLFQGISHGDLMQMVAHTKFGFLKFPPGKRIFRNGDRCDRLYFLINGCLRAETVSDDGTYSFTEEIEAPYVIQPERLFGIEQRFQGTMRTLTDVNFITIDKKEVANL
ncbi:MAG: cyclic nucleotide-binding domain-containing protein, partial [Prevotella sp.]|nr:cyclic nucleotide-binding domain-containing protein [Prevotella sp.]